METEANGMHTITFGEGNVHTEVLTNEGSGRPVLPQDKVLPPMSSLGIKSD